MTTEDRHKFLSNHSSEKIYLIYASGLTGGFKTGLQLLEASRERFCSTTFPDMMPACAFTATISQIVLDLRTSAEDWISLSDFGDSITINEVRRLASIHALVKKPANGDEHSGDGFIRLMRDFPLCRANRETWLRVLQCATRLECNGVAGLEATYSHHLLDRSSGQKGEIVVDLVETAPATDPNPLEAFLTTESHENAKRGVERAVAIAYEVLGAKAGKKIEQVVRARLSDPDKSLREIFRELGYSHSAGFDAWNRVKIEWRRQLGPYYLVQKKSPGKAGL